jgi:hypothetical protein
LSKALPTDGETAKRFTVTSDLSPKNVMAPVTTSEWFFNCANLIGRRQRGWKVIGIVSKASGQRLDDTMVKPIFYHSL